MTVDYDVVVVGAGPAGLTSAYHLARKGFSVAVLERGGKPGEKNVMGGVLYLEYFRRAFPDLTPPYEREVEAESHFFISGRSVSTVSLRKYDSKSSAVTLFRAKFDPWLAEIVKREGVTIFTDTLFTGFEEREGKIFVRTDRGDLSARYLVGADGVNSTVAEKSGIHGKLPPENLFASVKMVIRLSQEEIERRFNLSPGRGIIIDIIGHPDFNLPGGGFIYTNRDSISFGTGAKVSFLIRHRVSVFDLLQTLAEHPFISRLIEGGELVEISTHLIPFGYPSFFSPVFARGRVFLTGDAMGSTTGDLSGLPVAFLSGIAVSKTIEELGHSGDSSRLYLRHLAEVGLLKIFRTTRVYHLLFRRSEKVEKYLSKLLFSASLCLNSIGETGIFSEIKEVFKEREKFSFEGREVRDLVQEKLDRRFAEGFITLDEPDRCLKCENKNCLKMCPGKVYEESDSGIVVRDYRCLECGFCRYFCEYDNIKWSYPPGGKGVIYKYG